MTLVLRDPPCPLWFNLLRSFVFTSALAMLACGPVYAPPFEVQAVAYAMGVHSKDVQLFAAPPGTTIAGKTSALAHDPRFAPLTENTRWVISRNCRGGTP